MFIQCRKPVKIKDYANGREMFLPKDYIGSVPTWVEKDNYFKLLCKDGTITAHVSTATDTALEKADAEAKALQERRNAEAKRQKEIDEQIEAEKISAEEEAKQLGLDEVTKKNYVKKKLTKIKEK